MRSEKTTADPYQRQHPGQGRRARPIGGCLDVEKPGFVTEDLSHDIGPAGEVAVGTARGRFDEIIPDRRREGIAGKSESGIQESSKS